MRKYTRNTGLPSQNVEGFGRVNMPSSSPRYFSLPLFVPPRSLLFFFSLLFANSPSVGVFKKLPDCGDASCFSIGFPVSAMRSRRFDPGLVHQTTLLWAKAVCRPAFRLIRPKRVGLLVLRFRKAWGFANASLSTKHTRLLLQSIDMLATPTPC